MTDPESPVASIAIVVPKSCTIRGAALAEQVKLIEGYALMTSIHVATRLFDVHTYMQLPGY